MKKLFAALLLLTALAFGADLQQIANGSIDQAIEQLSRTTQTAPNDASAHLSLARAYYAVGRWDDAIKSELRLAPKRYALDADPPNLPDATGSYAAALGGTLAGGAGSWALPGPNSSPRPQESRVS